MPVEGRPADMGHARPVFGDSRASTCLVLRKRGGKPWTGRVQPPGAGRIVTMASASAARAATRQLGQSGRGETPVPGPVVGIHAIHPARARPLTATPAARTTPARASARPTRDWICRAAPGAEPPARQRHLEAQQVGRRVPRSPGFLVIPIPGESSCATVVACCCSINVTLIGSTPTAITCGFTSRGATTSCATR